MRWTFGIMAMALLVAGCGQMRPLPPAQCELPAYRLKLGDPQDFLGPDHAPTPEAAAADGDDDDDDAPKSLVEAFSTRLQSAHPDAAGHPVTALVLSGGSQHGAFGAGFFVGMANKAPVPDYDIVTGVSTGALQSTFVFLANRPVPADIAYPAFMRARIAHPDPQLGSPGQTNLRNLALAYAVDDESDLLKVYAHGQLGMGVAAARHGSLASFAPLRATLTGLISPDTIRAVAREAKTRSLMVAATDIDDGYAYAIDLTELAAQAVARETDQHDASAVPNAVGCYVEALIASSSVPPGVPPVSLPLQRHGAPRVDMFIDGGARYGVFLDQILKGSTRARITAPVELTLLVNGKLSDERWTDSTGARIAKWNVIALAQRSSDQLIDQVYRFSVFNEKVWALSHHVRMNYAFISNQGLKGIKGKPDDWPYNNTTCAALYRLDDQRSPQEFHPGYMRCLIDYGQARGAGPDQWNLEYPAKP